MSKLQETLQQNKEMDENKIKEQQRTYNEKFAQIDNKNESIRHLIDQQTEEQRQRNTEHEKLNQQLNEVKERTEKLEAGTQNEREAREKTEQQAEEQRRLDTEHEKLDQQLKEVKKRIDKLEADMHADRETKEKVDRETRKTAERPQSQEFATLEACEQLLCKGHPCTKCHKCRDWHFNGDQETWNWICNYKNWRKMDEDRWRKGASNLLEKRIDATCTNRIVGHIGCSFSFGLSIGGSGTTIGAPYARLCLCEKH
ncbi:unnamed protein product [Adineta steineri]|uniref:Uncharacterized protein n=1 Tax=Adineta steineri TaxID=433720 RepID=A0A819EC05_9BILA|nr:unnamed protein product [Adineta steineri]CAF3847774.1 unnamed protein product [Adineta steineri]